MSTFSVWVYLKDGLMQSVTVGTNVTIHKEWDLLSTTHLNPQFLCLFSISATNLQIKLGQ